MNEPLSDQVLNLGEQYIDHPSRLIKCGKR